MNAKPNPSGFTNPNRKWAAFAIVCGAQFIFLMDLFLLNVSAPQIRLEFDNPTVLKLVFASSPVTFAAFVLLGGRLGDRFGRRRIFVAGLVGAGVSALIATQAAAPAALIAARASQGLFAAMFVPQIMAVLVSLFEREARARALGVFGMVIGFGGVAGFLAGGLIAEFAPQVAGWRSIFWFTGLSLVTLAGLGAALLPSQEPDRVQSLNWASSILLLAAAGLIVGSLSSVGAVPVTILMILFGTGVAAAAFWLVLQRLAMQQRRPGFISAELAASQSFQVGILTSVLFFFANASFYLVTTLHIDDVFELSPLGLAVSYLPMGFAFILGSRLGAARVSKIGPAVIGDGLMLQAGGLVLLAGLAVSGLNTPILMALCMLPFGFAQGLVMAPLIGLILSSAKPDEAGAASGFQQVAQQFANGAGVAVISGVYLTAAHRWSAEISLSVALIVLSVASLLASAVLRSGLKTPLLRR